MAKLRGFFDALGESKAPGQEDDIKTTSSGFDRLDTIQKSLAIVRTIDKLKAQGVPITKKAELDYLLARQFLEKAQIDPANPQQTPSSQAPSPGSASDTPEKRNPRTHPEEFKKALEFSREIVAEVEALLQEGKTVSPRQREAYELGKKFLEKYS
jgi:hypothetical protein